MRMLLLIAALLVPLVSSAGQNVMDSYLRGTDEMDHVYYPFWTGDSGKELKAEIQKSTWIGVRAKSALEILKSCGYVIVDPRIQSKVPSTYPENAAGFNWGVISLLAFNSTWAKSTRIFSHLTGMSSWHEIYTNKEYIQPVLAHALIFIGEHGYVFNEKTLSFEPTQDLLPGCLTM